MEGRLPGARSGGWKPPLLHPTAGSVNSERPPRTRLTASFVGEPRILPAQVGQKKASPKRGSLWKNQWWKSLEVQLAFTGSTFTGSTAGVVWAAWAAKRAAFSASCWA